MGKLSVKTKNSRKKADINVYDLSFSNYHGKAGELKKSGTLDLDNGPYKIEAVDGDRKFQKVVLLNGSMTVMMDFSERFTPLDITDYEIRKALMIGAAVGAAGIIIMYLIGFEILSQYITL